jgi:hypothetical protein
MQKNVMQTINWLLGRENNSALSPRTPAFNVGSPLVLATDRITVTLAQANAGYTLLPALAGVRYDILDYTILSNGNFAAVTDYKIQDTADTPINVVTLAVAALTDGAIIVPGTANTTPGAGFTGPLTMGKGVQIVKNGSAGTGGTSLVISLRYKIVGG